MFSSRVRTEGRQAIARALRRQRALERCWYAQRVTGEFEALVAASSVGATHRFAQGGPNCANTLRCWTSIFLSEESVNIASLYAIVAGGPIAQLLDNANVALYIAARKAVHWTRHELPHGIMQATRRYCQRRTTSAISSLHEALLREDEDADLPRVFFCSLVWALPSALRLQHIIKTVDMFEGGMSDHEFALVKRRTAGRLEFQLVHGYSTSSDQVGFNLLEWQRSGHRFASHEGFDASEAEHFIAMLATWATADTWDPQNFANAFSRGETARGGRAAYWPAFSYRELSDDAIVGWGSLPLLDCLEKHVLERAD